MNSLFNEDLQLLIKMQAENPNQGRLRALLGYLSDSYSASVSIFLKRKKSLSVLISSVSQENLEQLKQGLKTCLKSGQKFSLSTRFRNNVVNSRLIPLELLSGGRAYIVLESESIIPYKDNEEILFIAFSNIISTYLLVARVSELLTRDSLTGLLNRDAFMSDLRKYGDLLDDENRSCLAMMHITNAEELNKDRGLLWTNEYLTGVSKIITESGYAFYRTGGVTFSAILPLDTIEADNVMKTVYDAVTEFDVDVQYSAVIVPLTSDVYKSLYLAEHFIRRTNSRVLTILKSDILDNEWIEHFDVENTIIEEETEAFAVPLNEAEVEENNTVSAPIEKNDKPKKARPKQKKDVIDISSITMEDFFLGEVSF